MFSIFREGLEKLNARASLDLNRPVLLSPHRTARSWDRNGWVKQPPRIHIPAVPRRSSWDNLNRDWCGHITGAHIHRNVYRHVAELRTVLEELYALGNVHLLRFHWPESKSSSRRGYRRPGGAGEFFFSYQPQKRADGAAPRRARPSCSASLFCPTKGAM